MDCNVRIFRPVPFISALKRRESPLLVPPLSQQRLDVARAVNHVCDIHPRRSRYIENDVVAFRPDSQSRMQIIASRPKFREFGETLKVVEEAVDKSPCGGFIVDGNLGVDLLQVSLGLGR